MVIWELSGTGEARQQRALRLIGAAFALLALYLLIQSTWVLAAGYHPRHSPVGIAWTATTAAVMFALAAGKARTGAALGNPVLRAEGRVTLVDGILAAAVQAGLALNAGLSWWWADPAAGYVLVFYAAREVRSVFTPVYRNDVPLPPSRRTAVARPGRRQPAGRLTRKTAGSETPTGLMQPGVLVDSDPGHLDADEGTSGPPGERRG